MRGGGDEDSNSGFRVTIGQLGSEEAGFGRLAAEYEVQVKI